jgi:hypothetical protein
VFERFPFYDPLSHRTIAVLALTPKARPAASSSSTAGGTITCSARARRMCSRPN